MKSLLLAMTATWVFVAAALAAGQGAVATRRPAADPARAAYTGYRPDFLDHLGRRGRLHRWKRTAEEMRLSYEPSFFTLSILHEDQRADALIAAARKHL